MLINQFFPKETNFNKVSLQENSETQDFLNGKPLKSLQWHTSYEKFNKLLR